MRLISIMLVFGAVALLNGSTPSLAAPNDDMPTREQCFRMAIEFYRSIPIDDEVMDRLEDARQFYYEDVDQSYVVPEQPEGCKTLQARARVLAFEIEVPCFCKREVMGNSDIGDYVELLRICDTCRLVGEAFYACQWGRRAGKEMQRDGKFVMIVGYL